MTAALGSERDASDALSDTNILLRISEPNHAADPIARAAVRRIADAGRTAFVVP